VSFCSGPQGSGWQAEYLHFRLAPTPTPFNRIPLHARRFGFSGPRAPLFPTSYPPQGGFEQLACLRGPAPTWAPALGSAASLAALCQSLQQRASRKRCLLAVVAPLLGRGLLQETRAR